MNVKPAVEPVVIAAAVRSTVDGEQTVAGLLMTTVGAGLTIIVTVVVVAH